MKRQRLTEFTSTAGNTFRMLDRPELDDVATRERLIDDARRVLGAGTDSERRKDQKAREMVLFRGMHACAREIMAIEKRAADPDVNEFGAVDLIDLHQRITDVLLNANLGLIYDMRRRMGPVDLDDQELRSAGMWALYQAVIAFDPWRGYCFSTYACNAISRGYGHVWKQKRARRRRLLEYADRNQRDINPLTPQESDATLGIIRDRLSNALEQNTGNLSATERLVIERRFLLRDGEKTDTLASVGRLIKLSKERVRQIQIEALGKLKTALTEDPVIQSLVGEISV